MHVILYVIDALRADHLNCYGYNRETSPYLDSLAEDSVIYENTQYQGGWTRASAGSILTGMYPPSTGLVSMYDTLPSNVPYLPKLLRGNGIETFGVSAMGNVSSTFGFNEGFDRWVDLYKDDRLRTERDTISTGKLFQRAGEDVDVVNPHSGDINKRLFEFLEKESKEDTFSLAWSIDTHDPYLPLDEFRKYSASQPYERNGNYEELVGCRTKEDADWIVDRYDDLIRQNDYHIGQLVAKLKELNMYDESMIIVTGDHGEMFGKHDIFGHSDIPVHDLIHVPLIVKYPGNKDAGAVDSSLRGHIDITPTVLSEFGIEHPNQLQGQDLTTKPIDNRRLFSHTKQNNEQPLIISNTDNSWKYIQVTSPSLVPSLSTLSDGPKRLLVSIRNRLLSQFEDDRLYRIRNGVPDESKNHITEEPEVVESKRAEIEEWLKDCGKVKKEIEVSSQADIDEETKAQLEQMGYI